MNGYVIRYIDDPFTTTQCIPDDLLIVVGVPDESQVLFNQPLDGCPNLTPVYIKGATKQKCEIQRNLTNTVQLR